MSLSGGKKEIQIAGKGHNEILEIVNPAKLMRSAVDVIRGHVPGNGGTCSDKIELVGWRSCIIMFKHWKWR
jgi:hypothetical protein